MNDKTLDELLGEAFKGEVTASTRLVVRARQKAEQKKERKERIKDYAPILLMVVVSTIITLLSSGIVFLYLGSMKTFLTLLACGMGITQIPIIICLLGSLYYKEIKD